MPCIFCIAVFALLTGAITTTVLDSLVAALNSVAEGPVRRPVDTASVATFELSAPVPGRHPLSRARVVPVVVTVYKKHKRVRIQVMTHALSRAEAEAVEDLIARALELDIVDRSDAHDEQKVREAFGEDAGWQAHPAPAEQAVADDVQDARVPSTDSRDAESRDAESRDAESHDAESRDALSRDAESRGSEPEVAAPGDAASEEAGSGDAAPGVADRGTTWAEPGGRTTASRPPSARRP